MMSLSPFTGLLLPSTENYVPRPHGPAPLLTLTITTLTGARRSQGTVGAANLPLGALSNASYTYFPNHIDAGLHNAPALQYVTVFHFLPQPPSQAPTHSHADLLSNPSLFTPKDT